MYDLSGAFGFYTRPGPYSRDPCVLLVLACQAPTAANRHGTTLTQAEEVRSSSPTH